MVLLGWAAAFSLAFPPIFHVNSYESDHRPDRCTPQRSLEANRIEIVFVVAFLLAASPPLLLYGRMLVYLRRRRRMKPAGRDPTTSGTWNFYLVPDGIVSHRLGSRINPEITATARRAETRIQPLSTGGYPRTQQQRRRSNQQQQQQLEQQQQRLQSHYIPMQVFHTQPIESQVTELHHDDGHVTFVDAPDHAPIGNNRLTRALFIMTLIYDCFWLPYVVLMCCDVFHVDSVLLRDCVTAATWFTYLQLVVLPLVYIFSHRPVGKHILGRHREERDAAIVLPAYLADVHT